MIPAKIGEQEGEKKLCVHQKHTIFVKNVLKGLEEMGLGLKESEFLISNEPVSHKNA